MRQSLSFLMLVLFLSCENKPASSVNTEWFDIPRFMSEIVSDMSQKSPMVSKTFMLNNEVETKKFNATDSSFWAKQLTILSEIDLNSAQLKGDVKLKKELQDEKSNLLIDSYTRNSKNGVPFKRLSIYYLSNPSEIRKITVELSSDNFIAHSETKVDLWLNRYGDKILIDSLLIIGEDITLMQATRCFQINTKTLWQ